ncbi:MAG: glutamylcysteine synthetase [Clostridiales Family XIII bacterium]|jgi:gamma-glutamylcysteine synthetase|nr:glutamylcysteine synthetase [Clostridiales Family XIII bacterium]
MADIFTREEVREMLYGKYIAPTIGKDEVFIGVEIEFPVLNLSRGPVDFGVVHDLTRRFKAEFGFYTAVIDADKEICSLVRFDNDDILSYDCSYNNLELSFGKEAELRKIKERFTAYYTFIQKTLAESGHTLTGLGVNPYRDRNNLVPIPNGRYRMLFHHLSQYTKYRDRIPMFFHPYPDYGMFSSASQVQLDVQYYRLVETIRAFSLLEPVKGLLFSNSVLTGENEALLCARDMLWENSTHGINPHNIGMYEPIPETVDELLEYIASTSIYCTEKEGKYINFEPVNIVEYFERRQVYGEYFDAETDTYRDIVFAPKSDDLKYLRSFKLEDLTFRGTIEFRSVCCQPVRDAFSVAAFHLGLLGHTDELCELFESDRAMYHHGYGAAELRKLFIRRELPVFADAKALRGLLIRVLDLASAGLRERGLGEEVELLPLYERAERLTNPARELLARTDAGESVENVVRDYAAL